MSSAHDTPLGDAIKQNRTSERILLILAGCFAVTTVSVIVGACVVGQPLAAGTGTLPAAALWRTLAYARQTGREILAMALLQETLIKPHLDKQSFVIVSRVLVEFTKPAAPLLDGLVKAPKQLQSMSDLFGQGWEAKHNKDIWGAG